MKYVHPDVLDNGPAYLRASATRALLLPNFMADMTYAQVLAAALAAGPVTPVEFTLSDAGTGRKVVFAGANAIASKNQLGGSPLHVALTDGISRILLVDAEASNPPVVAGRTYTIPSITYTVAQPQ